MYVLSLFDGMSCGQLALKQAKIEVNQYYAAEIDKHAIAVTQRNFPQTIQLGDVRQVDPKQLPKIDLLLGGSPCQGFSFAGKQLNFDDPRSALFFEYVRILRAAKPRYFLFENVVMKKDYARIISQHLGVEPLLIDSQLVSAQMRKRLYWTNIPGVVPPLDQKILWGAVREQGVTTIKYYYSQQAMQWLARSSRKRNKMLTVHAHTDKMQMLEASHHKKYSNQRFFGILDCPSDLREVKKLRQLQQDQYSIGFSVCTRQRQLMTVFDNHSLPFTASGTIPDAPFFFRYITPLECERLQTVPDHYTAGVSDTQRYRMLGNGWTVAVIQHILKNLATVQNSADSFSARGFPQRRTLAKQRFLHLKGAPTCSRCCS